MSEPTAFDAINSISTNTEINKEFVKVYNPFLTNYAMSLYADTIMYSNEMNRYHNLESTLQYTYYINSVKKRKRYSKWPKKINSSIIKLISEVYNLNYGKAVVYSKILNKEQLDCLEEMREKGGKYTNEK